jgi:hypothetical protein
MSSLWIVSDLKYNKIKIIIFSCARPTTPVSRIIDSNKIVENPIFSLL